jgi:hypothetical protein
VHDTLEELGWEVLVADAHKVKGLASLACKTDKIDAQVLAVLSQRDLVPAIWLPDPTIRRERELARFRLHLVRLLRQVYGMLIYNPMLGTWLGNAFNGGHEGRQTGQGYNYFRRRGRVVRSLPMLTCVAPSRFDGKPAFQLGDSLASTSRFTVRRLIPSRRAISRCLTPSAAIARTCAHSTALRTSPPPSPSSLTSPRLPTDPVETGPPSGALFSS